MAILIRPDPTGRTEGVVREVFPADRSKGFTLEELYQHCECSIVEAVPLRGGKLMWRSSMWARSTMEEGKLRDRMAPLNKMATQMLHANGGMLDDFVVGPALVTVGRGGELTRE